MTGDDASLHVRGEGDPRRVLVTGSSGAVGRVVVDALQKAGHTVRGFDRASHGSLEDEVIGDITDADAWARAADGIDTLVHLAATPDDADFMEALLGPNVVGVYRALEAAAARRLRRVVLASTMQTASGLLHGPDALDGLGETRWVSPDEAAPRNHYALTKVWAEQAGAMYARKHGLSVIAARIGWFHRKAIDEDDPRRHRGASWWYVSHRDAGRFFLAAVEAEHDGFGCYWCVGPGAADDAGVPRSRFDLEPGRRRLGYDPRDAFPSGSWFGDDGFLRLPTEAERGKA